MSQQYQVGGLRVVHRRECSVSEANEILEQFSARGDAEGWFCYTSSIWMKVAEGTQGVSGRDVWVSGTTGADQKGVLLSGEVFYREGNVGHALHIRSDADRYTVTHFEIGRGQVQPGAEEVRILSESFFGAIDQGTFPQWKLRYDNCWMLQSKGTPPHDIQVWQPVVGVFKGFKRGRNG